MERDSENGEDVAARAQRRTLSQALRPPDKLSAKSAWFVVVLTAVGMAIANLCTVFSIEFLVHSKFDMMQLAVNRGGVGLGLVTLVSLAMIFAAVATSLIHGIAPDCGGSGSVENKSWLNGFNMSAQFTKRNLVVRAVAVILSNATGFPVGREGPTVTMGSNMAFLLCRAVAETRSYAKEWVDLQGGSPGALADERFFARAARVACVVGGACGMAMIFDSPLGGILYMFEEVTSVSWPVELTFKAVVGCTICSSVSYALLRVCQSSIREFVIFEMWYGTNHPDFSYIDFPGFIILSAILGVFAPLHTKLCLKVMDWRKRIHSGPLLRKCQPWAKMADTVAYAALCAAVVALTSILGSCQALPKLTSELSYVQYQCPEGEYNPTASLLLTTAEGAVKRLFNRRNHGAFGILGGFVALLSYTTLNIGFAGLPVPSGNFTGTMLIGGLTGRLFGRCQALLLPEASFTSSGIYAMVGAAAMLCSFKHMTLAVVVFICQASNNIELVPVLMLAVTVSLFVHKIIGSPIAFDEAQILRKKMHYLSAEPCKPVRRLAARQLVDDLPEQSRLPARPTSAQVAEALRETQAPFLPVFSAPGDGPRRCLGLAPRTRLDAAVRAAEGGVVPADSLADPPNITIQADAPADAFYVLFAKAQLRAACVLTASGDYYGVISRAGLAKTAMALEEGMELEPLQEVATESGDDFSEGSETDSESDGEREALGAKSCRKEPSFLHI